MILRTKWFKIYYSWS